MLALYPFGKEKRSKFHVDDMKITSPDFKYRPFHPRFRDTLVCYLTQALNAPKQTFILMPKEASKPANWDTVKDENSTSSMASIRM
jgi:hypothetical protein